MIGAVSAGTNSPNSRIPSQFTSIGGQAVIEGVMMRSPRFIAVAVRRPNGRILVRHYPYQSLATRYPILKKPVLRGVALLLESMLQGVDALSFSANVATEAEAAAGAPGEGELSQWAMVGSIVTALALAEKLSASTPWSMDSSRRATPRSTGFLRIG
jgi:uncharacterized protein YqhQ